MTREKNISNSQLSPIQRLSLEVPWNLSYANSRSFEKDKIKKNNGIALIAKPKMSIQKKFYLNIF